MDPAPPHRLPTRLLAYLHHELRTPLAAMLTRAQAALRQPRTPEAYRLTLEAVERNVRELSRQVERMLEVAGRSPPHDDPSWGPVVLAPLLEACAATQAVLAGKTAVSVEVTTTPSEPVWTDPQYLTAIVSGLLAHAIQCSSAGGRVTLSAVAEDAELRRIRLHAERAELPSDDTRNLFDPLHVSRWMQSSRDADAVRLGLALVAEYAVVLGCTIGLGAACEGGAVFVLDWPENPAPGDHGKVPVSFDR